MPIEEIGVDEDQATASFRKKLEQESSQETARSDLFFVESKTVSTDMTSLSEIDQDQTRTCRDDVVGSDLCRETGTESCRDSPLRTAGHGDSHQQQTNQFSTLCGSAGSSGGEPAVFSTPSSSFQFQADWKILRHRKEDFYNYFKVS